MASYVLGLQEIDLTQVALVGGKGAQLGALSRIAGIRVPAGFCVTTDAYQRIVADATIDARLAQLAGLHDRRAICALAADLRQAIKAVAVPDDVAAAIARSLDQHAAYAVRSSATAEDSPTASFAGQHDSYLNVVGVEAVLAHVRRCWASLFTERAVVYRRQHGIDEVRMAVVVQQMVVARAAGVLFTADPVTGNRKVVSIEATAGLGEALVSGLVNPERYQVRDGVIVGTSIEPARQAEPALTDAQVVALAALGRQIEACCGGPQDIEWCLADDGFQIVQSRPITTLFPVPVADDREPHVYVSVGHQQMMTDAMKPLGISLFHLTAMRPMYEAGGRLFVDVAGALASPAGRAGLMAMIGKSEPLIGDALRTVVARGWLPSRPDPERGPPRGAPAPLALDPAIVTELIAHSQASIAAVTRDIRAKSGLALLDFILADLQELKQILFDPRSHQVFMTAIEATWWLNDRLQAWLGIQNAADTLAQSVPHNITSEMGLALLDVADAIRPYPEVVAYLQHVASDDFLDELAALAGGPEARDAIRAFLETYGMRCVGEIDISRPRWRERPSALLPMILGHVQQLEPGASGRRFAQGQQAAADKEHELLARLRALPDGEQKAAEAKQMIDRVRTFIGYREYPKYSKVSRYFVYRQALLAEAARLVQAHVLRDTEDLFYLTLPELRDVVQTGQADEALIRQRKAAFRSYQALTPPRVLTSEGEVISGAYRRDDVPAGALVGLPVSGGTVEGRARVVLDVADARLEAGDILVTRFTDPSWTPLFVAIRGLVTEVGGLMTHGVVVAREYGLPAVVGVEHATQLIRDGQRIRVHGTDGYVELLA